MALTAQQFPFTGPYGLASGPLKSKGPTAEALKRFFWHMGVIPAGTFDQQYNQHLWDLVADFKVRNGLRKASDPKDGSYGPEVCQKMRTKRIPASQPNAGDWALDAYSRKIVQDEAGAQFTSSQVQKVQYWIRDFWLKAISSNYRWHYWMGRPIDVTADPSAGGESDCSGMVIQSFRYAQAKTGILVPDPSKYSYKGYGNTDDDEDGWHHIGSPFRIGDLAHFHSERHVVCCIKPGNFSTAQWGSNGSESAPDLISPMTSYYRFPEEYMFTVRPPLTMDELRVGV